MNFDDYQEKTRQHAKYPKADEGDMDGIVYTALGLTGEAGEISNKVKKILRDHDGELTTEARQAIADELGDVLWYAARLADELRYPLELVAQKNLTKLDSRLARGVIQGSGDNR